MEIERLERELARVTQVCQQDGTDDDTTVQRLIGANMNILERIKQLQTAVGTRITTLNQSAIITPRSTDPTDV